MRDVRRVWVALPHDIDDASAPSGGNYYDRRVLDGLRSVGWDVCESITVDGPALAALLKTLPDNEIVMIDGLLGSAVPEVLAVERDRLRLVLLVHMIFGIPGEAEAFRQAEALIATSRWTRSQLGDHAVAAPPGVDPAPVTEPSGAGGRLICVGVVAAHKGHDVLLRALGELSDLPWTLDIFGSLDREPDFVRRLPVSERVRLRGPSTREEAFENADLLVSATKGESYGMVLTEALARGIPVLAPPVGGVPEAVGVPEMLTTDLAADLRTWLTGPERRAELRHAARERRERLPTWSDTVHTVAGVLEAL